MLDDSVDQLSLVEHQSSPVESVQVLHTLSSVAPMSQNSRLAVLCAVCFMKVTKKSGQTNVGEKKCTVHY